MITDLHKLRVLLPIDQAKKAIYDWKNDRSVTSWNGELYLVLLTEEFLDLVAFLKLKVKLHYHEENDTYMATIIESSNIAGETMWSVKP